MPSIRETGIGKSSWNFRSLERKFHTMVLSLPGAKVPVTYESAVCVRIESWIKLGVKIRIRIKYQIESTADYEWSKRDVRKYVFLIIILKHIKLPVYDHS